MNKLVEKVAAAGRTAVLVGDEALTSCATLAAKLLSMREGLCALDAELRVGQVVVGGDDS